MIVLSLIGWIKTIFFSSKEERMDSLFYFGTAMFIMAVILLYVFLYFSYPTIFWIAVGLTGLSILLR